MQGFLWMEMTAAVVKETGFKRIHSQHLGSCGGTNL